MTDTASSRLLSTTTSQVSDVASRLFGLSGGPEAELRPPVEVPTEPMFGAISGRQIGVKTPTRRQELEARGVDVEAEVGGTIPQRLAGQFGEVEDVKRALAAGTEFAPEDFEVVNVDKLGVVFKGPTDENFRSLDPARLDVGDIATGAAELIPAAAEIATGIATRNPAAIAAAGASARAALLKTLKEFGIVEDPDIIQEAAIEGGLSLAGGVAPKVVRALSPTRRAVESVAPKATGQQFQEGAEQLGEIAADVERAGGVRPRFTVGEELAAVEPEFAAPVIGAEEASGAAQAATRSQRQAREGLERELTRGRITPEAGEQLTQDIARTQAGRTAAAVTTAENIAEQETKRIGAELDKISGTTTPKEIRSVINKSIDETKATIGRSYDRIQADAAGANIDLSGVGAVANDIIEKVRIFPKSNKVFAQSLEAATSPKKGLDSYQVAQEARSELRSHIRMLKKNEASKFEIAEAETLEKEFSASINKALSDIDPTLAQRLVETDLAFKASKERLEKGFVGKLVSTREGEAVVPDEALLRTVLANTSDTQRFLNSADEFFPEIDARELLKDAFYKEYRDKVISGNVPHNTFMKQIKDTGDLIFSPEELKVLNNAGAAKNRVLGIDKKLKQRIKRIESTLNFKVGNKIEPHKLVDEVSKSPQKTGQLRKILTDDEWNGYVQARRSKVANDIVDNKGQLSLSGLKKVLDGPRSELNMTLGADYVKNLQTAQKFMTSLATRKRGLSEAKQRVVTAVDVTRALIYGPLSHEGFILNSLKGLGRSKTSQALTKMLNDPDLLRERIRIFKLPGRQQREELVNFWGAIGLPMATNRDADISTSQENIPEQEQ